jgi:5-methylthioadenosine/S-adenosylhomocysteine deaminase
MEVRDVDLLVRGGIVVTCDPKWAIYDPGAVAVDNGAIVAVGSPAEVEQVYRGRERIDAIGKLVMPGLINAHTHAAMTLFRGIADDLPLQTWLNEHIWPAEAKFLSPEFVRLGVQLAAAEMIRSGTTLFCDMYYFEDDIAQACKEAGIRVVIGEALVNFPTASFKTPDEGLQYTEHLLNKWHGDPLVVPAVQPHSPYAASSELLQRATELAGRYDVLTLVHVSETRAEVQESLDRYGRTPVGRLADLGVLGPTFVAFHGIHLTDADIELLAQHDAGVVHCPESQAKLASGFTPVPRLHTANVKVALGTDGAASNNDLDMFGEMSTAARLHKLMSGDPTVLPAPQVLHMATLDAARVLGLANRLGSLETGKRADLVVLDLDMPHLVPMYSPTSHLVYAAHSADVRTVVIDGRVVMRDRVLLTLDEQEIFAKAREVAHQIATNWGA